VYAKKQLVNPKIASFTQRHLLQSPDVAAQFLGLAIKAGGRVSGQHVYNNEVIGRYLASAPAR
jgi:hypothetical protein